MGVLVLVIGVLAFAGIYYQDQHVDAGASMIDQQTQAAEQAVKKTPNNIGARLELAAAYQLENRMDDALKQYDEVLKADGNHRAALLGRGSVLTAKGDLKGADAAYRKIVGSAGKGEFAGQDTQLAEAYYALGQIALKQGRAKEAVTRVEAAVKIDPGDADAWYLLGTANLKAGAPERAAEAFRTALKFVPTGWCEPYAQLTQVYKQLGDKPQAEYAGAMVDFCQKRPADAKLRLQALTSGPVAVDSMLALGMIAEKASDREGAIRWYQKVIGKDSKNFNARTGLSRLSAETTG
ncbi:MAG: tetratricopeptide repeat protein [Phycicoccus sp.]|nr:tetratricopeptide repeat protein [Phycicoccus sp.]NMM35810.1 tetratricopeptide repeat protein [Phycicoccus sp.]